MVYGIAFCPKSKQEILKDLGCADSKQLKESDRDEILMKICNEEEPKNTIGWAVDVISPSYISESMLGVIRLSLNEISMQSAEGLIANAIALGANITEVYVDTVGPPEKYQARLKTRFPDLEITVAKKADSTYPIVSAASICAKVTRDTSLKFWIFREEGVQIPEGGFGSGYPNDPLTKKFLENAEPVFGYPRIVRFSWATAQNYLEKYADKCIIEGDEEAVEAGLKMKKMTDFFNKDAKPKRERPKWFRDRNLEITKSFLD